MSIATINPATGETLKTFQALSDAQLEEKLQRAASAFAQFRKSTFADREQIYLFGVESEEVWQDTGNALFPFQRIQKRGK